MQILSGSLHELGSGLVSGGLPWMHRPWSQIDPMAHARPQIPQLAGSRAGSVQKEPPDVGSAQAIAGARQTGGGGSITPPSGTEGGAPHLPSMQMVPGWQRMPQIPQLAL